jgi:hypothetical protein
MLVGPSLELVLTAPETACREDIFSNETMILFIHDL